MVAVYEQQWQTEFTFHTLVSCYGHTQVKLKAALNLLAKMKTLENHYWFVLFGWVCILKVKCNKFVFWTRTLRNHFISLRAYYWNRELVSPPHGAIFWSKPQASQGHLWVKGWIRSPEIVRIGHQHLWTLCKFTSWDQKQLSAETAQRMGLSHDCLSLLVKEC